MDSDEGEILPVGRVFMLSAISHPFCVEEELTWGKNIDELMGNGEWHGWLVG